MEVIKDCYYQVKGWIGENHKTIAVAIGAIVVAKKVVTVLKEKADEHKRQIALRKWEAAPRDVVILHTLSRGKAIPNPSPFAMKLETWLRMSKIPYELDFELPWSHLGKTPWITLNGEHLADSQLIIKYLNKKYNVKIGDYTVEQQAIAKAVRVMMDEYLYWGIGLWRYMQSEGNGLDEVFDMPPAALKSFYKMVNMRVRRVAWAQGIGRHSKEDIIEFMKEVLQTASLILGEKEFLLGGLPCEEDASLFGFLSMVLWATPGSPYEKYMKEELPNLEAYCNRMKERFWTDWNQCLSSNY